MGKPVNGVKGLQGPQCGCTDIVLEWGGGGSFADDLFYFGGDGAGGKVELDGIRSKAGDPLRR